MYFTFIAASPSFNNSYIFNYASTTTFTFDRKGYTEGKPSKEKMKTANKDFRGYEYY